MKHYNLLFKGVETNKRPLDLTDEEFEKITGVEGAVFCHRTLFMAVAKSKEGAIKLAKLALN